MEHTSIPSEIVDKIHDELATELDLNLSSDGNLDQWHTTDCPFCGKEKHFGVKLKEVKPYAAYNCFKCSERGSLYSLTKEINRMDIWSLTKPKMTEMNRVQIPSLLGDDLIIPTVRDHDDSTPDQVSLPRGFQPIEQSEYLDGRGFQSWQYGLYGVGKCKAIAYKDYLVFPIKLRGVVVGYVGRCILSNEQIDALNRDAKKYGTMPKPRYRNSITDLGKTLGGFDEVGELTNKIILVEGLMDKASVDRYINSHHRGGGVSCLCTFGKKVTSHQLELLRELAGKGVKEISFMYDPDAMEDVKKLSVWLDRRIESVSVKVIPVDDESKDAGDMTEEEIADAVSKEMNPKMFQINRV